MSYVDEGPRSDRAVLMLHGNPTWSFYYRDLIQELSPTTRCIAPDHVGMGLSEKPPRYDYTLAGRIADVEILVASLGLRQIDLVVHDWGGAIGLGFATHHPSLVRRLVILNTAAFTASRIPVRIALCKLPVIGPLLVRGLNGFAWPATRMAMHRRALEPDEKRGYLFPYGSWADRVAINAFVRDIPMKETHPSWETLKAIESALPAMKSHRSMILWGRRDFCFNDLFLDRWRLVLPNAETRVLEDAGHYVLDDARVEAVPAIVRFLKAD